VVACEIADATPMSEIGMAVSKDNRTAILDNFRSFALNKLVGAKGSLSANRAPHRAP
jgi:hypothetical protein